MEIIFTLHFRKFYPAESYLKHKSLKCMKPQVYRFKRMKNNVLKCDKNCFIEIFWLKTCRDTGHRRGNNIKRILVEV